MSKFYPNQLMLVENGQILYLLIGEECSVETIKNAFGTWEVISGYQ